MGRYSMRNKYTNKALKQGNRHYNTHQGTTGYVQVKKSINNYCDRIVVISKILILFMLVIIYYTLKYLV